MIAHVFDDLCTACNACVTACPTHVFDPGVDGPPLIARPDQCQTCFLCELYCESDAIYVGPDQRKIEAIDPDAIRALGHLGQMRRDHGWSTVATDAPRPDHYWRLGILLREGGETAARRYAERHGSTAADPNARA